MAFHQALEFGIFLLPASMNRAIPLFVVVTLGLSIIIFFYWTDRRQRRADWSIEGILIGMPRSEVLRRNPGLVDYGDGCAWDSEKHFHVEFERNDLAKLVTGEILRGPQGTFRKGQTLSGLIKRLGKPDQKRESSIVYFNEWEQLLISIRHTDDERPKIKDFHLRRLCGQDAFDAQVLKRTKASE